MRASNAQRGFTMIELIMVIVIMGVIGGMVAVFMKSPIDAYFDSARRAALSDVADTTVRRMARDIHKALPNSLRNPGATCLEFIPTKTGARYRSQEIVALDGKNLDFTTTDTSFNMLGSNSALSVDQRIAVNDVVVVYNLGIAGSNAYLNDNASTVRGVGAETAAPVETPLTIDPMKYPLPSGGNRFHVVPSADPVVGYVCTGVGTNASGRGTGTLSRYIATLPYAAPASCPAAAVAGKITAVSVMATRVSACNFDYSGSDLQRNALVRMTIQITDSNETVSLQSEVHVNNTP